MATAPTDPFSSRCVRLNHTSAHRMRIGAAVRSGHPGDGHGTPRFAYHQRPHRHLHRGLLAHRAVLRQDVAAATPSCFCLASLEYATKPQLNQCELPGTSVMSLAT